MYGTFCTVYACFCICLAYVCAGGDHPQHDDHHDQLVGSAAAMSFSQFCIFSLYFSTCRSFHGLQMLELLLLGSGSNVAAFSCSLRHIPLTLFVSVLSNLQSPSVRALLFYLVNLSRMDSMFSMCSCEVVRCTVNAASNRGITHPSVSQLSSQLACFPLAPGISFFSSLICHIAVHFL